MINPIFVDPYPSKKVVFAKLRTSWERRLESVIIEIQRYKTKHTLRPEMVDITQFAEEFKNLMDSIEPK